MLTVKFTVYFHISARTREILNAMMCLCMQKKNITARQRDIEDKLKIIILVLIMQF